MADGGRWTVDGRRQTAVGGRWPVDGGRRTADGGRWTVDGGLCLIVRCAGMRLLERWTVDGQRRAVCVMAWWSDMRLLVCGCWSGGGRAAEGGVWRVVRWAGMRLLERCRVLLSGWRPAHRLSHLLAETAPRNGANPPPTALPILCHLNISLNCEPQPQPLNLNLSLSPKWSKLTEGALS